MRKYTHYSNYYEQTFCLDKNQLKVFAKIYLEVAKQHNFEPEIENYLDLIEESSLNEPLFEHVLYHVYELGKNMDNYDEIRFLLS